MKNPATKKIVGYACTWLSWNCAELGHYEEGLRHGECAQQIAKDFPADQYLFFKSLAGMAYVYTFMGRPQMALECGKTLLKYGTQFSNSRSNVMGYFAMSLGYSTAGDFEACINSSRKAIAVSKDPFYSMFPGITMLIAYVMDGQIENALDCAQELTSFFERYDIGNLLTHVNIVRGAALVASGRMDQGIKIIAEERKIAFENQRNQAMAISEFILGMIYSQIATGPKPNLSTMTKNVGFLMKNVPFAGKKAEEHFQKSIELTEEIGAHGYRGLSYLELGRLNQARKKTEKARHFIARAIEILEECRADRYLQKAREAIGFLD